MLSKPIAATRDAAIYWDDIATLKEATDKPSKTVNTKLVFDGNQSPDKAIQLYQLAYLTKQLVCFIDCLLLPNKYIRETHKHLSNPSSQADSENWILSFYEVDTLILYHVAQVIAHSERINKGMYPWRL